MPKKEHRAICRKQVAGLIGVSHSTTYRMVKRGELPRPVQLSKGRVIWWLDELLDFLEGLPRVGEPPPTEECDDDPNGKSGR